jgi:hypothetical protein
MISNPAGWLSRCLTALVVAIAAPPAVAAGQGPPDAGDQGFGLADLPAEHAALAGKATIDGPHAADPPRPVSFRDLWDHPDDWRGRRVVVRGTVARVFRQGPVGSFPALVEAWLSTRGGDLSCAVFPRPASGPGDRPLEVGREVDFTGTFLRPIRYAAADQPRLAPLVVGDRPPAPVEKTRGGGAAEVAFRSIGASPVLDSRPSPVADSWSASGWTLGLVLGLAAAVLAWQHLRGPSGVKYLSRRVAGVGPADRRAGDDAAAPPEFIDTEPADEATLRDPGRDRPA